MRHILLIGIGAGDPEQLTLQAVKALARADVFFLVDKGQRKQDLAGLRQLILERHAEQPYRQVEVRDPERDRGAAPAAYAGAVDDWRRRRADLYETAMREELAPDGCGAFLVWGDPTLYDSTLAALEEVRERGGVEFDCEVIPGISSVSALAAGHRTGLNQVGRPVQITTGRRLSEGWPEGVDDVVVMLDAHQAFAAYTGTGLWIYWGAYIGTPDEILLSGPLDDALAARIAEVRARARAEKGWIMDTYLLRRDRRDRREDGAPPADRVL
ncbi:precorrin-6A synthase (deacetylating) [Streptomyces sp. N2-109]|uniref:Precorrin-6A synthase (Deacetylating) n=1 Tax=Streptomyces gossypii TaxID=2883101 RepID=A0ABT2K389_9ACTN|nr:precorrin-6A synthase (deacetylating) [Streptomyces gossypii]MCT2594650.1 precorrin-6A synthase (deacetylating) [Streptomyces gossypii]